MRRILITGATGLVGSHLLRLLTEGDELHSLGRTPPAAAGPNLVHHGADLAEPLRPEQLPGKVDAVIHLAQSRNFRDFPHSAPEVARINVMAAVELAQYAAKAGARHFVYASTGGVYAPSSHPLTESAPLASLSEMSFYAATKRAGERLLAPFSSSFSLVVLRPFFIYGPAQQGSMLLPRLVDDVRAGEPIRLSGPEGIRINPTHASDAAAAVLAALALEGTHSINVAGAEVLSLRALAEAIGDAAGRPPRFVVEHEARGDLVADIETMRRLLVAPAVPLERGLRDLVEGREG